MSISKPILHMDNHTTNFPNEAKNRKIRYVEREPWTNHSRNGRERKVLTVLIRKPRRIMPPYFPLTAG